MLMRLPLSSMYSGSSTLVASSPTLKSRRLSSACVSADMSTMQMTHCALVTSMCTVALHLGGLLRGLEVQQADISPQMLHSVSNANIIMWCVTSQSANEYNMQFGGLLTGLENQQAESA